MTNLAIVSSYSESCGNACFTKVLHDSIENYTNVDVEVIPLHLKLLQSTNRALRKKADKYVKELAKKLQAYDAVNIQLEAGLYGTFPRDIVKRSAMLMQANRNTTVTLHSPRLINACPADSRSAIKSLLKFRWRAACREFVAAKSQDVHMRINRKLIINSIKNNCRLIVHTLRARQQIQLLFDYDRVDVHPLKFVPDHFLSNRNIWARVRRDLNCAEDSIYIGIFGYISSYKGHIDALEALKYLPSNYKLLIFGRQHPQTLKTDGAIDFYLSNLVKKTKNDRSLKERVYFLGELGDEDFLQVVSAIDVIWLPYYENGQDGSGIASLCLNLCQRVLCSASFAFDELFKLESFNNYLRFDIGNYLELALKTKIIMNNDLPKSDIKQSDYTLKTQAYLYAKDLDCLKFDQEELLQKAS
jgi:glycosyltransferase involved in cell wall biosynthesis